MNLNGLLTPKFISKLFMTFIYLAQSVVLVNTDLPENSFKFLKFRLTARFIEFKERKKFN